MPTDRIHHQSDLPDMSADLIAGRRFGQTWRGYDPDEVKQFLARVATQVRLLRERIEAADSARRDAEQRASHPEMDEAALMSAVGEETAGILRSARSAAAEITAKAEANAEALVAAAEAKATDLVARAESMLANRTTEAEATAAEILAVAQTEADDLSQTAQHEAEALAEEAADKYKELIQAAQDVRETILSDLARRRNLATVQIDQLRAGRERLLDAYLVVRRTLDEVTDELQRAGAEAKAAADAVGRQAGTEHHEEPLELRPDEAYGSPGPSSASKSAALSKEQLTPEQSPVGAAPKVAQVVTARGERRTETPAPALPAALKPEPMAEKRTSGARPAATAGQDSAAVVSRVDAIESVRILRSDTPPAASQAATAPPTAPTARAGKGHETTPKQAAVTDHSHDDGAGPATSRSRTAPSEPEGSIEHDNGSGTSQERDVQGLFARIRASRAQATTEARKALSDTDQPVEQDQIVSAASAATAAVEPAVGLELGTGAEQDAGADLGLDLTAAEGAKGRGISEDAAGHEGSRSGEDQDEDEDDHHHRGPRSAFLERRDEVAGHLDSSLARKLKRALQDEQNSILDRLRNLKGAPTAANVLPSAEEQPDRFVEAGRPLLQEAAKAGAQLVASLYGDEATQPGLELGRIDDLAEELGRAIAEPLHQRLELAFSSSDEDVAELAEVLGAAYREWKTQRIEAAARDQVAAAFARGAYLAFPEGAVLHWVVDPSEGPCPDCEDNELAGAQPKGEPWPTGQLYPPAHPGCRCALAPDQLAQNATIGAASLPTGANAQTD
jgi:DivIVA domain-containing protein